MTAKLSINEKARRDCVRHWQRMLKLTVGNILTWKEAPTPGNCAMCVLYFAEPSRRCDGCPIKQFTGKGYCFDTPYTEAEQRYKDIYNGDATSLTTFRAAVRAEIKFLQELEVD